MKLADAIQQFQNLDQKGIYVFSRMDIQKMFPHEGEKALEKSLNRLCRDGVLERVCKGIYVNKLATTPKDRIIEDIAMVLRRGFYSFVSLESILSEYGDISQIPVSVLTVMTTGAKGTYRTNYGTIEFTHTKRTVAQILQRTVQDPTRRLRLASRIEARKDLKRVGRNVAMIELNEELPS